MKIGPKEAAQRALREKRAAMKVDATSKIKVKAIGKLSSVKAKRGRTR